MKTARTKALRDHCPSTIIDISCVADLKHREDASDKSCTRGILAGISDSSFTNNINVRCPYLSDAPQEQLGHPIK
jgi:hypothetical protein